MGDAGLGGKVYAVYLSARASMITALEGKWSNFYGSGVYGVTTDDEPL
jgi:hypothetical protein